MKLNDDKYFTTIEEFTEKTPAKKMIVHALNEIKPDKDNWIAFAISFFLGTFFAFIVGINENTVKILLAIEGVLLNVLLYIFGYLFTIYAILLAFLSDSYVQKLSELKQDDGVSFLKSSTSYYESVLFLYFIGLTTTGIIMLFLNCIENEWTLTPYILVNNILVSLFLIIYFTFIFRIIYELKSTIYNTIVLFRQSLAYKVLIIFKAKKEGEQIDNNNK